MRYVNASSASARFFAVFAPPLGTLLGAWAVILQAASPSAEPVVVRQMEGALHGFLVLRSLDDTIIANGDLIQSTHGGEVSSRLVFHFKDGSLQDETAVFSQRGHFRLLADRLVQKGPAFKRPMDVSINGSTGLVTVRYQDDKGKDKIDTARLSLPSDLANGIVPILLKNIGPGTQSATYSMVVATPKPLLVKLGVTADGEDSFSIGGAGNKAIRYAVKVDIAGIRGVLAPLVGKQPPDTHVWILGGSGPAFLKSEGPSYESGPIWRIELASPVWPKGTTDKAEPKK
jgi:hypothetical protein